MTKQKKTGGQEFFGEITQKLINILNNSLSKKYRSELLRDAALVTIKAASSRSSIHAARKRMKRGKSRRRIASVLGDLDLKEVTNEINNVLKNQVKRKFRGQDLTVAIDIHAIPYYGHPFENKEEIGRSKQKDGTTRFHMLATAYLVGKGGKRFTLAVMFVPLHTTMKMVVYTLLDLLRKCGVKVNLLLLDRGFYSVEVVKLLMRLNIGFIIPMRGKRLKKKKGGYRTTYQMKGRSGGKSITQRVNAISVIKYNRGKRFKHHGAMQLCFITFKIQIGLRQIAELYRKRFGIESSYKLNKAIRPRTSSRNPAIRMFLFGAAVLIQNIWVEIKLIFCKRINRASPLMITLRDFADILLHLIRKSQGENTEISMTFG